MAKKKEITQKELITLVNKKIADEVYNTIADVYIDNEDILGTVSNILEDEVVKIITEQIKPRIREMAKDSKLMDKLAKKLLTDRLTKGL